MLGPVLALISASGDASELSSAVALLTRFLHTCPPQQLLLCAGSTEDLGLSALLAAAQRLLAPNQQDGAVRLAGPLMAQLVKALPQQLCCPPPAGAAGGPSSNGSAVGSAASSSCVGMLLHDVVVKMAAGSCSPVTVAHLLEYVVRLVLLPAVGAQGVVELLAGMTLQKPGEQPSHANPFLPLCVFLFCLSCSSPSQKYHYCTLLSIDVLHTLILLSVDVLHTLILSRPCVAHIRLMHCVSSNAPSACAVTSFAALSSYHVCANSSHALMSFITKHRLSSHLMCDCRWQQCERPGCGGAIVAGACHRHGGCPTDQAVCSSTPGAPQAAPSPCTGRYVLGRCDCLLLNCLSILGVLNSDDYWLHGGPSSASRPIIHIRPVLYKHAACGWHARQHNT